MQQTRFAVIGTGIWGITHARIFAEYPAVELAAVCDADAARAKSVAQETGATRWCTSFADIAGDDSITAVGIATPDFAHAEAALAVLRAGKHLLVEAPRHVGRRVRADHRRRPPGEGQAHGGLPQPLEPGDVQRQAGD